MNGFSATLGATLTAEGGQQQASDGCRLVGDIRLDARRELAASLGADATCPDAALVLRAWRAWGEACLDRIHGDFAFAIWDERAQRLFCARDRFGVRPFFYGQAGDELLLGNTPDALRRHPGIDDSPYEPALADYLVVGNLLEPDRSFFAGIRRLPPGHRLTFARGPGVRVERYWTLPVEPELRYRRDREYVEHFVELLSRAIADRCPPGPVTLFLSGGLDSAAIAAVLAGKLGSAPDGVLPRAICLGWNKSFADPEPRLARVTARALGLPLTVHEFADCEPLRGWGTPQGAGPEPEDDFYRSHTVESLQLAARHSRVALFGRGGDEIFAAETLAGELRRGAGLRALSDAAAAWLRSGQRPPLGLRSAFKGAARPAWIQAPPWLSAAWLERLRMDERLRALDPGATPGPRARARYRLGSARWIAGYEFADPGYTGVAVDCRYPFGDERLVRFALRLPPLRWCTNKALLRRALAPVLPEAARRAKQPLAGEPLLAWLDRGRVGPGPHDRGIHLWRMARVSALARWLKVNNPVYTALEAVA